MNKDTTQMEDLSMDIPHEAAAYWDAKLRSAYCTDEDRARFIEWKQSSKNNLITYNQLQASISLLKICKENPELSALREQVLLHHEDSAVQGKKKHQRFYFSLAASFTLICFTALLFMLTYDPLPEYSTMVGERSTFSLSDGTVVTLNTNSLIKVDYTEQQRMIYLIKGQALFEVMKDTFRPFIVEAKDKRVEATGTTFEVNLLNEKNVKVTLIEGEVKVDSIMDEDQVEHHDIAPKILLPGEQLITEVNTTKAVVTKVNTHKELKWKLGEVFFEDTPLNEAIDEMNRYSNTQVSIKNTQLANIRIGGHFTTGNQERFVNHIIQIHPSIKISHKDKNTIVLTGI